MGPKYQWTLSAPIQTSSSVQISASTVRTIDNDVTETTTSEFASAGVCDVARVNQFCMTLPQPHSSTCWPLGVTGPTHTILIDLWMSGPSLMEVMAIDKHVKTSVSDWAKTCLKFDDRIWSVWHIKS